MARTLCSRDHSRSAIVRSGLVHAAVHIEARIPALWAKQDARPCLESMERGQQPAALKTEKPPQDFYR